MARLLVSSSDKTARLRALKLTTAWHALSDLAGGSVRPLEALVDQAARFVARRRGASLGQVRKDVVVEQPVRKAWETAQVNTSSAIDIEHFYRSTDAYVLELTAANHQVETLFNYSVVLSELKRLGVARLIDFGAGIGTFVLLASRAGIEADYCDLPSVTMRYAEARLRRTARGIRTISADDSHMETALKGECIVCLEVLEHLPDPESLVRRFHRALLPRGLLVVSQSFDYIDEFCTHLPQHRGKGARFDAFMEGVGFARIPLPWEIHPRIYAKVR